MIGCLIIIGIYLSLRQRFINCFSLFVITVIIGFWYAHHRAHQIQSWQLPLHWEGELIYLEGKIQGVPREDKDFTRFDVLLSKICLGEDCAHPKALIRLYAPIQLHLMPNDSIKLHAKLKRPWGMMNPGGFDTEKQLFFERIRAIGTVKTLNEQLPQKDLSFDKIRQTLKKKMLRAIGEEKVGAMLIALTIGTSDGITHQQWELLRYTGITHLIAISGMHITLVAGMVFALVRALWRVHSFFPKWVPAQIASAYIALLFSWFYSFLAGMSISTQRSCIMVSVCMLMIILKMRISQSLIFIGALLIVLIWDPFAVLSMGFWLSYLSVGLLLYALSGRLKLTSKKLTWKLFRAQWVIFFGLIPINLALFNTLSFISPFANFIAIPWVSFIITPMCLLGALFLSCSMDRIGEVILHFAVILYQPLWWLFEEIQNEVPQLVWNKGLPEGMQGTIMILASSMGVLILLLPKGFPGKIKFGLSFCLPLICYVPPVLNNGEFKFTLLDVGQGLSSVIQTKKHALIFDVGPKYHEELDCGNKIIIPFLKNQNIRKMDALVISHTDLDHRGGLNSLLKEFSPLKIYSSEPEKFYPIKVAKCMRGEEWQWDGVYFKVLHPGNEEIKNRNNRSCVLKVSTRESSLLLTGDIEKEGEVSLLTNYIDQLPSTVLVVPHHGSKTSSIEEFVEQVAPKYALFPVGKNNYYGFPHEIVLERYQNIGAQCLSSAQSGAIQFYFKQNGQLEIVQWREQNKQFWHDPSPNG